MTLLTNRRTRSLVANVQLLEKRQLLAVDVLDFEELDPNDGYHYGQDGSVNYLEYSHAGYELQSTASDHAAELNGRWRTYLPGGTRYTGSMALSSVWAPVTISLNRTDGDTFSIDTIDLYPWLPVYQPTVEFTAQLAGGGTVQQTFDLVGATMQTYQFSDEFENILVLSWEFTGFDDYHTFDNLVLDDQDVPVIQIDIDDIIDLKRDKVIEVVLFSSESLLATDVEVNSLELTINDVAFDVAQNKRGISDVKAKDVDGDGRIDLVVGFSFDDSILLPGDYYGSLSGTTPDGRFAGFDSGQIARKTTGKPNTVG